MTPRLFAAFALALALPALGRATTLPPELKAYDFGEAYYVEDGGVVISPYASGFSCADGIATPEGIRVMPGSSFIQFDEGEQVEEVYHLQRVTADERRAFFHEDIYKYATARDAQGRWYEKRGRKVDSDDFYLSHWRSLEWFDHVFTGLDLHPGLETWRTRPKYN
jgi:hypothetical protein